MTYSLAVLRVEDYGKWKESFDSDDSRAARRAAGERSYRLFRTLEDHNAILLLNEWEDEKKAIRFIHSDKLRELQKGSGVLGEPAMYIFVEIEKGAI